MRLRMCNVLVITKKQDITANVFILFPLTNFVGTYFPSSRQGLKSHWPADSFHLPNYIQLYTFRNDEIN